jgi:hypothetical protein
MLGHVNIGLGTYRHKSRIYTSGFGPRHVKGAFVSPIAMMPAVASHCPVWSVACINCVSPLQICSRSTPHFVLVKAIHGLQCYNVHLSFCRQCFP